jgi:hypothetical protein
MNKPWKPHSIIIDGASERFRKVRYLVRISGNEIFLPPLCFRLITILAIWRASGRDKGWVHTSILMCGNVSHGLYRLRREIYRFGGLRRWRVVENDHQGYYRLIANPSTIQFNRNNIRQFGDEDLTLFLGILKGEIRNGKN